MPSACGLSTSRKDGIVTEPARNGTLVPIRVSDRIAEPLAVVARYSRGGRANADRLLFSPSVSADGGLVYPEAAVATLGRISSEHCRRA